MKYVNQKCTHCNKLFEKDDDVVVCPVCGTPQHRECYEENNQCINHHKHKEGYVWSAENTGNSNEANSNTNSSYSSDGIICGNCGTKNSSDSIFCKHCSTPLRNPYTAGSQGNADFQDMPFTPIQFRINENEEIAPDVKLGEAQKYVKNNSLLFSLVFKRIHDHNRSRFNFFAFLFSGGWFLYRKQYLLGTILTILFGLLTIGYNILSPVSYQILEVNNLIIEGEIVSDQLLSVLSNDQINVICFTGILYIVRAVLMVVSGLIANRCYYKHVIKKVRLAKAKFSSDEEVKKHLSETGGVNMTLGYILLMAYVVVKCIPLLF